MFPSRGRKPPQISHSIQIRAFTSPNDPVDLLIQDGAARHRGRGAQSQARRWPRSLRGNMGAQPSAVAATSAAQATEDAWERKVEVQLELAVNTMKQRHAEDEENADAKIEYGEESNSCTNVLTALGTSNSLLQDRGRLCLQLEADYNTLRLLRQAVVELPAENSHLALALVNAQKAGLLENAQAEYEDVQAELDLLLALEAQLQNN